MPTDRTAEVVEAMARARHNARNYLFTWDEYVTRAQADPISRRYIAGEREAMRAALRALPPGYVVTTVPGEADEADTPRYLRHTPNGVHWTDGHNACRTATLAAAVRVEEG